MTIDDYLKRSGKTAAAYADGAKISEASLTRIRRGEQNVTADVIARLIAASDDQVTADGIISARRNVVHIDTQSDPGSWKKAIAHSPNLNVEDFRPDPEATRVVICDVCEARVDGATPRACTFADCPHAQHADALGMAA